MMSAKELVNNLSITEKIEIYNCLYEDLAGKGIGGDTELAHVNKTEMAVLRAMGGSGTINPNTNLIQFMDDDPPPPPPSVTTTTQTSEFPSELRPFVQDIFEKSQAIQEQRQEEGFRPELTQRLAAFTPEQEASFTGIEEVVGQSRPLFDEATALSRGAARAATDPEEVAALMNPFLRNVTDIEKREAQRAADVQRQQLDARAAQAGAFGGSRAAILEAERQRNLNQQLGDIEARGRLAAFQDAQNRLQQQFGREAGTAAQLGALGSAIPAQTFKELGALSGIGAAKQQQAQRALDIATQQAREEYGHPMATLQDFSAILRGFPLPATKDVTQKTFSPAQPLATQLLGVGTGLAGLAGAAGAFKKAGGRVGGPSPVRLKHGGYIKLAAGGGLSQLMRGKLPSNRVRMGKTAYQDVSLNESDPKLRQLMQQLKLYQQGAGAGTAGAQEQVNKITLQIQEHLNAKKQPVVTVGDQLTKTILDASSPSATVIPTSSVMESKDVGFPSIMSSLSPSDLGIDMNAPGAPAGPILRSASADVPRVPFSRLPQNYRVSESDLVSATVEGLPEDAGGGQRYGEAARLFKQAMTPPNAPSKFTQDLRGLRKWLSEFGDSPENKKMRSKFKAGIPQDYFGRSIYDYFRPENIVAGEQKIIDENLRRDSNPLLQPQAELLSAKFNPEKDKEFISIDEDPGAGAAKRMLEKKPLSDEARIKQELTDSGYKLADKEKQEKTDAKKKAADADRTTDGGGSLAEDGQSPPKTAAQRAAESLGTLDAFSQAKKDLGEYYKDAEKILGKPPEFEKGEESDFSSRKWLALAQFGANMLRAGGDKPVFQAMGEAAQPALKELISISKEEKKLKAELRKERNAQKRANYSDRIAKLGIAQKLQSADLDHTKTMADIEHKRKRGLLDERTLAETIRKNDVMMDKARVETATAQFALDSARDGTTTVAQAQAAINKAQEGMARQLAKTQSLYPNQPVNAADNNRRIREAGARAAAIYAKTTFKDEVIDGVTQRVNIDLTQFLAPAQAVPEGKFTRTLDGGQFRRK